MNIKSDIDNAHSAMVSDPENAHPRRAFYQVFADTDLFLLLEQESVDGKISPRTLTVEGADYILAFDQEERLADFTKNAAQHAVLNGRAIAAMLSGQGLGLGLNLGVAESSFLMPPEAIDWVNSALDQAPQELQGNPSAIATPENLTPEFLKALEIKMARAGGLADFIYLAAFTYGTTAQNTVVFVNAIGDAHSALAKAVNEAVIFSGHDDIALDVVFLERADPILRSLEKVGLRIHLPKPEKPNLRTPSAPGKDPSNPPILR